MSATNHGLRQRASNGHELSSQTASDPELVFESLADDGCRDILEATSEEALTATELSDRCDIPLSTTYRKLEQLADANLLDEQLRIRASGQHTAEYRKDFEDITVTTSEDGHPEVEISRPPSTKQLI